MQARLRRFVTLAMLAACILAVVFVVIIDRETEDEGSPTVVAAIEKQYGDGYVDYLIREKLVSGGEVVFSIGDLESEQPLIEANYVKKNANGWVWGYGGGFGASNIRPGLTDEEARETAPYFEYFPDTEGSQFGNSPFPMIYGIVTNPEITRITAKDASGLEKQAEKIEVERNFSLFYVFVDKEQGPLFDVIGYDADGKVLHQEKLDRTQMFDAETGQSAR
ncbi:hypothetical protein [Paenibacillus sp. HB172176]|uniref:hypothetical protein n=1 Tax=Paenibacillus sp. HB172176 TaxID=2493690 RepID=UPI00143A71BD|nr:hypothetical protein [Paenibacillus sp. HB172176]